MNCWEFHNCGREQGGREAKEKGVCPAAEFNAADGFLEGTNGGRACAFIAGLFCCKPVPGTKQINKNCPSCDFFNQLKSRYGMGYSVSSFLDYLAERQVIPFLRRDRERAYTYRQR